MEVGFSNGQSKIRTIKIDLIDSHEFDIFFLQILLNNPKFILFLLNLDNNHLDKSKLLLKDLAFQLITEDNEKKGVNPFEFLSEFYKQKPYVKYTSGYIKFLENFLSLEFWERESNNLYNSIKSPQTSFIQSMFYFKSLKYDYYYNSSKYMLIPFIQIDDDNLNYKDKEINIEEYLKIFIKRNYGLNKRYFDTFPEILIIFINRSNYYYKKKILINEILNLNLIEIYFKCNYNLIGIICLNECFYKNFFNNQWYIYEKNKNIKNLKNFDEIKRKNLSFSTLIYVKSSTNYTKEIEEIFSIKSMIANEIPTPQDIHQQHTEVNSFSLIKYPGYGKVGLKNIGCTCFMNSVLQCLKNLYQMTHYFLTIDNTNKELTTIYKDLLINLCKNNIRYFSPKKIKFVLGKKDSEFLDYTPNDSKEFLMLLFECLGIENPLEYEEGIFQSKKEDKEKFQKAISKIKFSHLSFLFNFALKKSMKCLKCQTNSENFQFYHILDLPIITENGLPINSLFEAIKYLEKEKNIKCKCGYNIKSKTIIYTLPEIFIIHLQRSNLFEHSEHYVDFPHELSFSDDILRELNIFYRNNHYELIGVINHYGSQDGGHNFSYCKNFFDNEWYEYNDEEVIPINKSYICTRHGFLLFYQLNNNSCEKNKKIKTIVQIVSKN